MKGARLSACRAHGWRFLAGSPGQAGPPYRMLLDSGIHVGTGMDGAQAAPIDPWLNVYYMVTGKNVRGELINDGQQITREEAVWALHRRQWLVLA
jgi:predicted amidohydrolase YtcJ